MRGARVTVDRDRRRRRGHRRRRRVRAATSTADAGRARSSRRPRRPPAAAGPPRTPQPLVDRRRRPPTGTTRPAETSIDVFADVRAGARRGVRPRRGRAAASSSASSSTSVTTTYLGISTGLRLRHVQPTGPLELTGKSADLAALAPGSGGATRDFTDVDVAGARRRAAPRGSAGPSAASTCRPAATRRSCRRRAVADLMIYAVLDRRRARRRTRASTVFSQAGRRHPGRRAARRPAAARCSATRRAAGLRVRAVRRRARRPATSQSVFDNGLPLGRTDWIRDGELTALLQTRHSAELTGLPVTPGVDNLLLERRRRDRRRSTTWSPAPSAGCC